MTYLNNGWLKIFKQIIHSFNNKIHKQIDEEEFNIVKDWEPYYFQLYSKEIPIIEFLKAVYLLIMLLNIFYK